MPEASLHRLGLGLSQPLWGPGRCTCFVSTFFRRGRHPTRSLGARSSLADKERKTVISATSSNRSGGLCNRLTEFSFCLFRQLSPGPDCRLSCGYLGVKHYRYQKNKFKAYAPDGEIPMHSVGSHGKWVPGCSPATGLRGKSPVPERHVEAHWECVFARNSNCEWRAIAKWWRRGTMSQPVTKGVSLYFCDGNPLPPS